MTRSRPRVAFLGVYHETNTFSPVPTGLADFAGRWYRGQEITEQFAGTRTVGGGFIDGARAAEVELVPVFAAYATPSGPVTREAFEAIRTAIDDGLDAAGPIDGVLFELHGDLVVDGEHDAEEALVAAVRERLPGRPIATVLDLHANMSLPRLRDVEILVGYRTNPHVDTYERGLEAVALLAPLLQGEAAPYRAHRGLALVVAPLAQRTDDEPLRSLYARADELQAQTGVLNVTVHAGYAYADTEYTGLGFEATARADRRELAERAVEQLLELAISLAPAFRRDVPDAAESVERAVAGSPTTVIADTGDNINGGAPGDTTWLLREALRYPGRRFLGTIADPAALRAFEQAGVGARVGVALGGWASPRSGAPIEAEVEVLRLTDGRFTNVGPMSTGATVSMHGAAWVRFANVDLVVQGAARQPNDPAMFTSMGIAVDDYDVLLLKGAAALRAAWAPVVAGIVDAATPGETDSLVGRLEYRRARPLNR